MDIRKLQRAIVDGLEDVKAQDIVVFNTEHLSPLFERVIIASGTSNRQTKALASSVRDAVKSQGLPVLGMEGGDNGEWIIVDCGPAVAHIMQPAIRDYYRLEEIWGGKNVKMKIGSDAPKGLVKAEVVKPAATKPAPAKKAVAAKMPGTPKRAASAGKAAPAKKAAPAGKAAPAKPSAPARKVVVGRPAAAKKSTGGKAAPARKSGPGRPVTAARKAAPGSRAAGAKTAARKTSSRG